MCGTISAASPCSCVPSIVSVTSPQRHQITARQHRLASIDSGIKTHVLSDDSLSRRLVPEQHGGRLLVTSGRPIA